MIVKIERNDKLDTVIDTVLNMVLSEVKSVRLLTHNPAHSIEIKQLKYNRRNY